MGNEKHVMKIKQHGYTTTASCGAAQKISNVNVTSPTTPSAFRPLLRGQLGGLSGEGGQGVELTAS